MTAPLIVDVTFDHIDAGITGDQYRCPIALAIQEQTDAPWAAVDGELVCLPDQDYHFTAKALNFINRFDADKPVKPTRLRFYAAEA